MATWDKTKYEVTCECGKKYSVIRYEQPMREKGRFTCNGCGKELERWNGAVDYTFTEIEGH
ncbi:hypothetical protein BS623_23620 [Vibrio parahaemolyticus]|uniref:hypothetical protein n=1 Tax=Vibrio parahaemolyticus TaxID=670 RepID=UPI0004DF5194|nr:hypothetical protein [Vibrio parahaemolyticus]EGQ8102514.1 hypothetical protein [Vibrio parahaemolyticus]EGQ9289973.1 hypothetical protein [Vibrio parahaemolyticus]ELA9846559.1 hypothetical protein [Vibrio parahaemolyticus]OUD38180.1 hypothetical protein BS623_23620 [Vibrio parahaemolyticus]TOB04301.1 hypothetical protein CGK13_23030 [Vibrio parahaemolyticus]